MSIPNRLSRLEAAVSPPPDHAIDAEQLIRRIASIASRFPEDAATIPLEERLGRMSPAQHVAWTERFMDEPTPVAEIISMHATYRRGDHHADR